MKKSLAFVIMLFAITIANAQTKNRWLKSDEAAIAQLNTDVFAHNYKPAAYKVFKLDEAGLKNDLLAAPSIEKMNAAKSSFIISVPNSDGNFEKFRVVDAPVMEPELAAKYPEIKSYAGQGIDEPTSTIRFSVTPLGFNAMILSSVRKTIYINALSNGVYLVFDRDHLSAQKEVFDCNLEAVTNAAIQGNGGASSEKNADDGKLRTYRLALCVNGEYSVAALNGAGGTDAQKKAIVLAVLTTNLTRANGIYERDFGIHMNFVANETSIIYLVASTDPFTTSGAWNSQTQTTCDNVIGNTNYDIGHLIAKVANSSGNNGNAGCIGCVCKTGSKGSGFSAHTDVQGDPLVVDYWTHEMGHQYGANHTFTFSNENTTVQVEPGSGSTIMGYAGITGVTTDIQAHSDDYFQALSISQITDYVKTGSGAGCAVVTVTGDATPTANAGADYTIPKSTPFTLSGTGSDADAGDVLSYCWEQIDDYTTGSNTIPSSASTTGPQFRSYNYTTSTSRTFPALSSILGGSNSNKWEVLPSVARNLNFRFTVRDNHAGGGNNNSDDMIVTVSSTTGPFTVTQPNTAVTWAPASQQTVTWAVNGTNGAPINCANVKISLSTDGGTTFSTLVASTPNDGSELVTMPNSTTAQARIKIEAIGNIFFDISDNNFTIDVVAPCDVPTDLAAINVTDNSATLFWTGVGAAVSYDVDYKASSSPTWINAATGLQATSVDLSGLASGTLYDCRVRSNCSGGSSAYASSQFTTTGGGACPSSYDVGNNNNFGTAVQIPVNANVTGLINVATDKDFYKFTLANAGSITITLTTLPADYDLTLLSSSNVTIQKSKNRGTTSESITYNASAGTLYLKVNSFNGASNASLCYTLNVSAPNGIHVSAGTNEAAKVQSGIKLYPNPAKDIININLDKIEKNSTLRIFDLYGKVVLTKTVSTLNTNIDVKQLPAGLYFVKVYEANGEQLYNAKFIKQ